MFKNISLAKTQRPQRKEKRSVKTATLADLALDPRAPLRLDASFETKQ